MKVNKITLSEKGFMCFLALVEKDVEPNEKLKKAAESFKSINSLNVGKKNVT